MGKRKTSFKRIADEIISQTQKTGYEVKRVERSRFSKMVYN